MKRRRGGGRPGRTFEVTALARAAGDQLGVACRAAPRLRAVRRAGLPRRARALVGRRWRHRGRHAAAARGVLLELADPEALRLLTHARTRVTAWPRRGGSEHTLRHGRQTPNHTSARDSAQPHGTAGARRRALCLPPRVYAAKGLLGAHPLRRIEAEHVDLVHAAVHEGAHALARALRRCAPCRNLARL